MKDVHPMVSLTHSNTSRRDITSGPKVSFWKADVGFSRWQSEGLDDRTSLSSCWSERHLQTLGTLQTRRPPKLLSSGEPHFLDIPRAVNSDYSIKYFFFFLPFAQDVDDETPDQLGSSPCIKLQQFVYLVTSFSLYRFHVVSQQ